MANTPKTFFFEPIILIPEEILCKIMVEKTSEALDKGGLSSVACKVKSYK